MTSSWLPRMSGSMSELTDAIANAVSLLPTGVKSDLGVHFLTEHRVLRISGTDGYTFVTQALETEHEEEPLDHFLDKAIVKALPKDVGLVEVLEAVLLQGVPRTESNILQLIDMATSPLSGSPVSELRFAPDRIKKIGALKPSGLPIVCKLLDLEHITCIQFDYGDASGIFTLLEDPS